MKTYWIKSLAAWMMLGAIFAACTKDEIIDEPQQGEAENVVHFTATLAPKDGSTRAITSSTDGDGKEILNVNWAKDEKIAVYYETTDGHATATATVTGVVDGVATIKADLSDAIDGSTVKFVYPYWLAKDGEIDEDKLLNEQNGTLNKYTNSISKQFDAATGSGTLSVSPGKAVTTNRISLTNRCCICKFNLGLVNPQQGVNDYVIIIDFEGSHSYVINTKPELLSKLYVAMLPETSAACTIMAIGYSDSSFDTPLSFHKTFISNVTLEAGKFYRNVPITLNTSYTDTKTLTASTGELTLQDGDILTGTGGANTRLKIEEDATVVLSGVTNTAITEDASIPGIECLGNATIILAGSNSVTGRWNAAGIFIPSGKTLTILGSGSLRATGGSDGAGIGGTEGTSCGSIIIQGGTVTATGTGECAGIGSGSATDANIICGDISISGGTVTAKGGNHAAGIGSGDNNTGINTCGAITISGGTVTAKGGEEGAGIGSGHANKASNTCGAITISGGTVTAQGGMYAAGIGSGNGNSNSGNVIVSSCGAISITGGTVEATSGDRAAGIGSGSVGKFTSISIGSGITRVTATRSNDYSNVPIGKGNNDRGSGAVTIDGQTLTDAQTGGTAALPTFPNLRVEKSDGGGITNKTWTITKK